MIASAAISPTAIKVVVDQSPTTFTGAHLPGSVPVDSNICGGRELSTSTSRSSSPDSSLPSALRALHTLNTEYKIAPPSPKGTLRERAVSVASSAETVVCDVQSAYQNWKLKNLLMIKDPLDFEDCKKLVKYNQMIKTQKRYMAVNVAISGVFDYFLDPMSKEILKRWGKENDDWMVATVSTCGAYVIKLLSFGIGSKQFTKYLRLENKTKNLIDELKLSYLQVATSVLHEFMFKTSEAESIEQAQKIKRTWDRQLNTFRTDKLTPIRTQLANLGLEDRFIDQLLKPLYEVINIVRLPLGSAPLSENMMKNTYDKIKFQIDSRARTLIPTPTISPAPPHPILSKTSDHDRKDPASSVPKKADIEKSASSAPLEFPPGFGARPLDLGELIEE